MILRIGLSLLRAARLLLIIGMVLGVLDLIGFLTRWPHHVWLFKFFAGWIEGAMITGLAGGVLALLARRINKSGS